MTTYYNQNGMTDAKTKKDLLKAFDVYANRMMNTHHLYNLIKHQIGADIRQGDYVISTDLYDSSIFVVPQLFKPRTKKPVETPNPYDERVVDSEYNAYTRRATKGEQNNQRFRVEKRIKVRKLSLLMWNAETNQYPTQSVEIIFRQREINFAEQYATDIAYCERGIREGVNDWRTAEMIEKLKTDLEVLQKLAEIPPFIAFYDGKYGFLIKREVRMNQIVFETIHQDNPRTALQTQLEEAKKEVERTTQNKEEPELSFKEAIVREALHPKRMEAYVEKHGIDGAMEMFDPREANVW